MTAERQAWKVGFVGVTPVSHYLLERLNLSQPFQAICIAEPDGVHRGKIRGIEYVEHSAEVISSAAGTIVFADRYTEADVGSALDAGIHVILDRVWNLSAKSLTRLAEEARRRNRLATYVCLQRWSSEFLLASQAMLSGRLGEVHSIRRTTCEKAIPFDASFAGALKEFGFHWIDQLILLNESEPELVFAERFKTSTQRADDGFLATIRFTNHCLAVIELQTHSHLSFRSGWMLDGSRGAYRSGQLYTLANDGELIDEPLRGNVNLQNDFFQQLRSSWQDQQTELPNLDTASRVTRLLESIEYSALPGNRFRS